MPRYIIPIGNNEPIPDMDMAKMILASILEQVPMDSEYDYKEPFDLEWDAAVKRHSSVDPEHISHRVISAKIEDDELVITYVLTPYGMALAIPTEALEFFPRTILRFDQKDDTLESLTVVSVDLIKSNVISIFRGQEER